MRRFVVAACLAASACGPSWPVVPPPVTSPPPLMRTVPETRPAPPGLDLAALDERVDPCDDFYAYACGGWLASTSIPEDRSRWSRGYSAIAARTEEAQRALLEAAVAGQLPAGTPDADKLGAFYGACMDEARLEQSLPALREALARMTDVKDVRSLAQALGGLHARGIFAAFSLSSTPDAQDTTRMIGEVAEDGLGLPERDYYLRDDEKSRAQRQSYVEIIQRVFGLLGQTPEVAARSAASVLELETALARASLSREERIEPRRQYHRLERAGLKTTAPDFPWDVYFTVAGAGSLQALNVTHPPYFQEVARLARTVKPAVWKTYLQWYGVQSLSVALPKAFRDEGFRLSQLTFGAREPSPRWKTCVRWTQSELGDALARPFLARTLGAQGKQEALGMMKDVLGAFERELDTLTWMDAPTREGARLKANAIALKVAYPDRWRDYSALQVTRDSFLASVLNTAAFAQTRRLAKVGKPVDRIEWVHSPLSVNAYYNASFNEIYFMAGHLLPPLFSTDATVPVNLGTVGAVMGHELIHAFDSEGRQYDAQGNLRDWWTPASDQAFRERAACVKTQFDGYTALEDLKVNGTLTLGENLADLGGLKLAHAVLEQWRAREPEAARAQDAYRFTPHQQLFIGAAQARCSKSRDAYARMAARLDGHAPDHWRINGTMSNLPEFQRAFHCPADAKLVRPPAERCEVW